MRIAFAISGLGRGSDSASYDGPNRGPKTRSIQFLTPWIALLLVTLCANAAWADEQETIAGPEEIAADGAPMIPEPSAAEAPVEPTSVYESNDAAAEVKAADSIGASDRGTVPDDAPLDEKSAEAEHKGVYGDPPNSEYGDPETRPWHYDTRYFFGLTRGLQDEAGVSRRGRPWVTALTLPLDCGLLPAAALAGLSGT